MHWLTAMGERGQEILSDPERAFGEGVRATRIEAGLSQRGLADAVLAETAVRLDPSAITRIEAGRSVTLRQAVAIAYVLGVETLDMLLDPHPHEDELQWADRAEKANEESQRELEALLARAQVTEQTIRFRREQIEQIRASYEDIT